jgi:hypothetical protein
MLTTPPLPSRRHHMEIEDPRGQVELEEIGDDEQILTDDVIDDDNHADPDQEDIGENDHDGDGELDRVRDEAEADDPSVFEDTEIDGLPDVGELDPNEEPELDELDEEKI